MSQDTRFEDYLRDIFFEQYRGTDDNSPDAFDYWLSNLDIEEIIGYGNRALEELTKENE